MWLDQNSAAILSQKVLRALFYAGWAAGWRIIKFISRNHRNGLLGNWYVASDNHIEEISTQ